MADEQVSLTSLILIVVLGGLVIRYLFFSPPAAPTAPRPARDAQSASRAREAMVQRIQEICPHVDRRTILWDFQRHGGHVAGTVERILSGQIEAPPVTFQPPPLPTPSPSSTAQTQPVKAPPKPAEPDLITRYKLQNKVQADGESEPAAKTKAWSSNRDERQATLQRRRDDMILAARRRMEATIAAEKAAKKAQQ